MVCFMVKIIRNVYNEYTNITSVYVHIALDNPKLLDKIWVANGFSIGSIDFRGWANHEFTESIYRFMIRWWEWEQFTHFLNNIDIYEKRNRCKNAPSVNKQYDECMIRECFDFLWSDKQSCESLMHKLLSYLHGYNKYICNCISNIRSDDDGLDKTG